MQAASPGGQGALHRRQVVERDDQGGQVRRHRRPDRAPPLDHPALGVEHGEGLVHGAVVAVVDHDDLRPAGQVAGVADHVPVRVRGGERELPLGQAEAPGQLLGGDRGVLGRQHRGDAPAGLEADRRDGSRGEWPDISAGVAQAQVDVLDSVHAGEVGALGLRDVDREGTGPLHHPRHRHAAGQVPHRPLGQRPGPRPGRGEDGLLGGLERGQPGSIGAGWLTVCAGDEWTARTGRRRAGRRRSPAAAAAAARCRRCRRSA